MQWMVELFCREKHHERIIRTAMVTMGNNAELSRQGHHTLAAVGLLLTVGVTLVRLETPTFHRSSKNREQV